MNKINIICNGQIELAGGVQAPVGSIIELSVMGVQMEFKDFPKAVGFSLQAFANQTQLEAKNPLIIARVETQGQPKTNESLFNGSAEIDKFIFETDTQGNLTNGSLESLKEYVMPYLASQLTGIVETDLV